MFYEGKQIIKRQKSNHIEKMFILLPLIPIGTWLLQTHANSCQLDWNGGLRKLKVKSELKSLKPERLSGTSVPKQKGNNVSTKHDSLTFLSDEIQFRRPGSRGRAINQSKTRDISALQSISVRSSSVSLPMGSLYCFLFVVSLCPYIFDLFKDSNFDMINSGN